MRFSQLFVHTVKENPAEEDSVNARYLTRGGFVRKIMAGVYTYMPLGLRVLNKIENIVRDEMNAIGAHEILMPALQPSEFWKQTGRWDGIDVMFKLKGAGDRDLALGCTHEEIVTPLVGEFIQSYRDLPIATYQIQTKFRNEARAKSGILRGREFRMKDMYSFDTTEEGMDAFYDRAHKAYTKVYDRCGIGDITYFTYASGGVFSKYSHEYQMLTPYGEDHIHICDKCRIAINEEIIDDLNHACPECGNKDLRSEKAIEVGNIFKLMTRFSDAFGLKYNDQNGAQQDKVYMGCYGIGSSRVMGAVVEASHDDAGIIWPAAIAPFDVGLLNLKVGDAAADSASDDLYKALNKAGMDVLYDDRDERAGSKFADMDLIGLPWQVIVGPKGLAEGKVEIKNRKTGQRIDCPIGQVISYLTHQDQSQVA